MKATTPNFVLQLSETMLQFIFLCQEFISIRSVGKWAILVINRPKMNRKLSLPILFLLTTSNANRDHYYSECDCFVLSRVEQQISLYGHQKSKSWNFFILCFPPSQVISRSTAPIKKNSSSMRSPCWRRHVDMFSIGQYNAFVVWASAGELFCVLSLGGKNGLTWREHSQTSLVRSSGNANRQDTASPCWPLAFA